MGQQLLIAATLIPSGVALAALVFLWAYATIHREEINSVPSSTDA